MAAKDCLLRSFQILSLALDPQLESPNVVVQPFEGIIDCAVKLIRAIEPRYFKGVRRIEVLPLEVYGKVKAGGGQDPAVVLINAGRIKTEVYSQSGKQAAIKAAARIIAHEVGHVRTFNPETGQFEGGENPAEAEEARMGAVIEHRLATTPEYLRAAVPCLFA